MTGRSQMQFVMRVEDELRQRRDRALGRCTGCGKTIARGSDYTTARGGLVHSSCGAPAPGAGPSRG